MNFILKFTLRRFVRCIQAVSFHVIFPSVINAAETAFLIATQEERSPSMSTKLIQQAGPALAIAKGNELFPEQLDPNRRTIRSGQLPT
jgi:hypothetical protein